MQKELILMVDRSLSVFREKENILSFCWEKIQDVDLVSVCLFSDDAEFICFRQPPELAIEIAKRMYYNDGATAIYDAMVKMTTRWDEYLIKTQANASHVHLYVITDGNDTSSKYTDVTEAAEIVKLKKEAGWSINILNTKFRELDIFREKGM